jgi:repressor LexA
VALTAVWSSIATLGCRVALDSPTLRPPVPGGFLTNSHESSMLLGDEERERHFNNRTLGESDLVDYLTWREIFHTPVQYSAAFVARGQGTQETIVRQPLTARQQQALDYISTCLDKRGYPPTLREIGEHMGIRSTNGVNDHLKALERKGYLVREELKSRALRPVDFEDGKVQIPIVGKVAAGQPILAQENIVDKVTIDRFFIGTNQAREVFGLVVQGESMIEAGIFDGDYIFVRKQPNAEQGEIVVAMIDGEATCKRYYSDGDVVRLEPANSTMNPIMVRRTDFRPIDILGKVVGVYRKLN